MVQSYKREAIDRMGSRLSATLKRCNPPIPTSLRLTATRVVKEGIIRGMQGYQVIYPGVKKLAEWGGCSERQARRNARTMEEWGLLVAVEGKAGGNTSTRYVVEPEAIIRIAMALEANPHPELIAEIREFRADMTPDMRGDMRGDIDPGHMAGHMSAGIYNTPSASMGRKALLAIRGGRRD